MQQAVNCVEGAKDGRFGEAGPLGEGIGRLLPFTRAIGMVCRASVLLPAAGMILLSGKSLE